MSHATNASLHRRRASQRGSALLIVLVFAAVIAIMLYRELPVATFEAQRQKEELLIDRGNEYKRAIQLYVRKIQNFPPSIDALENTNRMRFLRGRFVDPFTGKADWRLLHAGPGGMIIDSKLKQKGPGGLPGGPGSTSASTLGAASSVTNPFANSFDGSNPNGAPGANGNNFPQRPPAISANGNGGAGNPAGNEDLLAALQQTGQLDAQSAAAASGQIQPGAPGGVPTDQAAPYPGYPAPPNSGNPMASASGSFPAMPPGRFRGANPTGNSYPDGQFGGAAPSPTDPQTQMQNLLNNQNPVPGVQNNNSGGNGSAFNNNNGSSFNNNNNGSSFNNNGNGSNRLGTMNPNSTGGGIAGVASKSPGRTIKVVNDQKDRTLWEFVYDMQKEAMANAQGTGIGGNGNSNNSGNNGSNTFGNNGGNTFGNNSSSSGFSSPPTSFPGSGQTGAPGQSSTFSQPNQ